jgi:uncharacterized delta-60 repeat protein
MTKSPTKNHFLKNLFTILFFCFLAVSLGSCGGGGGGGSSSPTPSITTWAKTFGGVNEDVAHSVQQTTDGGYIVAGGTSSSGAGFADFWIIKLKPNGDIDWQKIFGGANDDVAYSIQQTSPDGGYIVAGQSSSLGNPLGDIWILKLKLNGDIDWQKTYGGTGSSTANCIRQTLDGGYIVAGETSSSGAGSADVWVLKLDANGDLQPGWPKTTYGGIYRDAANSIQQTSDGGYIVAGETSSSGANIPDFLILKLDSNGNFQWQRTYGGSGYDIARSIQEITGGGYIVAGETSSSGAGSADVWVLKLDTIGDLQPGWPQTYGGIYRDVANSIQQTLDGGYIVAGETASSGAGNADFWILKLNASGDIVWQKTYGGSNDDIARSIQQTLDGGFIVAGETSSSGAGYADFWILKIDENGNI